MEPPTTGLILMGGGARAAYQVGVLAALSRLKREAGETQDIGNPFPIIAGTSAGAINAAALACGADDFDAAVAALLRVWRNFRAEQVYRADAFGVMRSGAKWLSLLSLGWALARWRRGKPRSLLDNEPLRQLLERMVPLERLPLMLRSGHLHALALSGSSYSAGEHVTFYDAANDIAPWARSQRLAERGTLTYAHLMASSAIPFIFPAVPLQVQGSVEYFGDGSMRQAAPISPAVHLGADRILVIGAGRLQEPAGPRPEGAAYPSLAQIAGHALSNIFLDALAVDIERLQRVNHTLSLLGPDARARTNLRPIELLVIAPSQRLDGIAARHLDALPAPMRALLRTIGVSTKVDLPRLPSQPRGGSALASYLLFEAPYTRELIALGETDTFARRDDVLRFFGWGRAGAAARQGAMQAATPAKVAQDAQAAAQAAADVAATGGE